jgi:ankyrin repeat protein
MKKRHAPSPVTQAVLGRDAQALAAAIAAGEDVDQPDKDGRTPLHHAAINGDVDAATQLIAAKADVSARDAAGWAPLHFAAGGWHLAVAELLIEAGAAVDPEDSNGNTPLFRAVFESRGRGEMIQLLLRRGADRSHANKHGMSPAALATNIANYDVSRWFQ